MHINSLFVKKVCYIAIDSLMKWKINKITENTPCILKVQQSSSAVISLAVILICSGVPVDLLEQLPSSFIYYIWSAFFNKYNTFNDE